MRTITSRLVMLVATAAVAPLVLFGAVSVYSLRAGTRQSVIQGNLNVAARAAEQIEQYMENHVSRLRLLADTLHDTQLEPWQQTQVLTNLVLDFEGLGELTLFGPDRTVVATSRLGGPTVQPPQVLTSEPSIAPVTIDDDFLPTTTVSLTIMGLGEANGWLVGKVSLEELWRMVDRIRVGREGFAMVVAEGGQLIAHGNPDQKSRTAAGDNLGDHELVVAVAAQRSRRGADGVEPSSLDMELVTAYLDDGRNVLAVAAPITSPEWTIIVEQPASEAFGLSNRLEVQLMVAVTVALVLTVALGYYWGRSFIRPILALTRGTEKIAGGRFEERVDIGGTDEFHQSGRVVQQHGGEAERAAGGRPATGTAGDVRTDRGRSGPRSVPSDPEHRQQLPAHGQAVRRPRLSRHLPTHRRPRVRLDQAGAREPAAPGATDVARAVSGGRQPVRGRGGGVDAGDGQDRRRGAGRAAVGGPAVHRNLILNAIEATAPGGVTTLSTEERDDRIRISIRDTGTGIPHDRLDNIFEDFKTTKRTGLGLGLAISRKIVDQLGGDISVTSTVGHGTTFSVEFARVEGRPDVSAAAS